MLVKSQIHPDILHLKNSDNDGAVSLRELLGHPVVFFPTPIQSIYKVFIQINHNLQQVSNSLDLL